MAEGTLAKLTRLWGNTVIPAYQANSILRLFPSDNIGDESVVSWAQQVIKDQAEAKLDLANADWSAGADKLDLEHLELKIYRVTKRLTMNRAEQKLFEKTGVLPLGLRDAGAKIGKKASYFFCQGPATGDAVPTSQYNYLRDAGSGSGSVSRPLMASSAGGKWNIAPNCMNAIATLAGQLEIHGYSVATSIVLWPRAAAAILRRPIAATSTTSYIGTTIRELIMNQGFMGIELVEDEWLYTAAGANPTADLFDIYAVDLSQVRIGYTVPETSEVIEDKINKRFVFDFQVNFCPLFIPRYIMSESKYYKGVSRLTAIDTTSTS